MQAVDIIMDKKRAKQNVVIFFIFVFLPTPQITGRANDLEEN